MQINPDLTVNNKSLGDIERDLTSVRAELEKMHATRIYWNQYGVEVGDGNLITGDLTIYKECYIIFQDYVGGYRHCVVRIPYRGLTYQALLSGWCNSTSPDTGQVIGDSLLTRTCTFTDSYIRVDKGIAYGIGNHNVTALVDRTDVMIPIEVWVVRDGFFYN